MWKAGHSLIKSKMREEKALLAGEMSGHMFFADRYYGYDDAIYAMVRLLEILSKTGRPLSDILADVPKTYSTPEIRRDCPDDLKFLVVERLKDYFKNKYPIMTSTGSYTVSGRVGLMIGRPTHSPHWSCVSRHRPLNAS